MHGKVTKTPRKSRDAFTMFDEFKVWHHQSERDELDLVPHFGLEEQKRVYGQQLRRAGAHI